MFYKFYALRKEIEKESKGETFVKIYRWWKIYECITRFT